MYMDKEYRKHLAARWQANLERWLLGYDPWGVWQAATADSEAELIRARQLSRMADGCIG